MCLLQILNHSHAKQNIYENNKSSKLHHHNRLGFQLIMIYKPWTHFHKNQTLMCVGVAIFLYMVVLEYYNIIKFSC